MAWWRQWRCARRGQGGRHYVGASRRVSFFPITGIGFLIGKIHTFYRIRIEIVVEMNAVNIVTANNILDYSDYKVPVLGNSGSK